MRMLVSQDWLRRKIDLDPDIDAEAGTPMELDVTKDLREQTYLGDGVYAEIDGYQVWLGLAPGHHAIALEPAVIKALLGYCRRVNEKYGVDHFDVELVERK